ncbi:MAG: isoprenoid synthase domain-containing protein [Monoraphidium minutum]|nr:MAG: isoprenoid synthase domain-containing protein [Monoraphidium minutum]
MAGRVEIIDAAMSAAVPALAAPELPAQSPGLRDAMRYSLLGGGKRIRGAMCLAACELLGGSAEWALPTAAAIEMVNASSLIHDDLPALDNDDVRRGRPTCHKVFGDAAAILAGDALLVDAFLTIVRGTPPSVPAPRVTRAVAELAAAAGSNGLQQGQAVDMACEGPGAAPAALEGLRYIHAHKTGAMVVAAVLCGAHLAGGSAGDVARLRSYAQCIGLVYQIMDDVFDATASASELGKTPGKDAVVGKATYVSFIGVDASIALADQLTARAKAALSRYPAACAAPLLALADYVRRVGTKSPLRGAGAEVNGFVHYPHAAAAAGAEAAAEAEGADEVPRCR